MMTPKQLQFVSLPHATPVGVTQRIELQHACVALQACPYCAQVGGGVPPSVGGGTMGCSHVPMISPEGMLHSSPTQQSADVRHDSACVAHPSPQMSWDVLFGSGRHGA